jgi:hypothetical protein
VVEDDAQHTVLWLPPDVTYAMGDDLLSEWKFELRVMPTGQLRISRRNDPFSVHLFRQQDDSFRGWYVNLERPQRRTSLGFDYEDELLDIWCELGKEPELLDEDELEEAVRRDLFSAERAAEVRANAEGLLRTRPGPPAGRTGSPTPGGRPRTCHRAGIG